jgi:amino acid adenylation domain-containing protein
VSTGDRQHADKRLQNLTPAQRRLLEQRLMQRSTATARRNTIPRRETDGPAELSYAQELLWLLTQVFDDGIAYNSPGAFQLQGKLDLDVLRRAFNELIARHAILRTTYTVIGGEPMQLIAPHAEIELNIVDLRGRPTDEQYTASQQILKEESRFPFDLVTGPVIRPTVIRLSDDEQILMVNMHHVCTDGYSRTVLYRDLTVLYEALASDLPSPLPPLAIQYADYAVWQRHWLDQGVTDAQLDYWKRKLARAPSRLDLPTDCSRPPVRSYLGEQISVILDLAIREGLRNTARAGDATLFVALLALFAELLHRYSGQDDVVIGTPFAGRNRTELESMVGYFINPLALRIDTSGDPTFAELVSRARETTLEAFAHADIPYELIVRAINPERDLSQTPVFQAMIVLHNPAWQTQRPKFEPEGIRCAEITHEKGWAKFDVLLGMSERTTGLNTTWEYSTELFRPDTVRRMMDHFRTLAESAATGPDRPLSKLSMLSEEERAKVVVSWNAPGEPLPQDGTVKECFESQAAATPDADAVVFEGERMTYGELNRSANRIASRLRAQGVGPGTIVAVMMEKSLELVPAVLAVVKAGGAYVPLDPRYPPDRLQFMLDDADPKVLLTQERLLGTLPETRAVTLAVDAPNVLDGTSDESPETSAGSDDLAYVIYTSGSTGQPKGAMITIRSLLSAYRSWERVYGLRELRSHLQMASFSFDVFTGDLVRAMLSGGKLVLCPIDVMVDPPRLYELMVREGVDAAEFVPATALLLFEYLEREGKRLEHLQLLAVASEAWRNEKYDEFKALCGPQTRLLNSYGLTEATIDSTWFERRPGTELAPGRLVPIGRPFPNTSVYILDRNLEPQPIGIPGELCVGGTGVAAGYLNRPELTSERFVPDPFSAEPGARMYRTGDLARWLADGTIEFIGRTDRQLKIRGFRIEPGEIESVLEHHDGVRAAAVTDKRDESGDVRLVAYLAPPDPEQPPAPDDLRALVADHLPAYMIPSAWVFLDALPLTPNGKVDMDSLPDPEFDRSATTEELVPPRNDTERALAAIWSEVLGVEELGVYDNFFALGGHSLLAVRLFSQIERELGVKVPLATLFQTATIAGIAEMIDAEKHVEEPQQWDSVVTLRPGHGRPPLFLIPWVDGELLGYRELSEHWGGWPLYGLTAPGVDGRSLPLSTVEEMASYYITEIRKFQSHGPYYIGGFCSAGVVAYEIGRQLSAQGEELGMIALIDAYFWGSRRPSRLAIEREKWTQYRSMDRAGRVTWLRNRLRRLRRRVRTDLYFRSGFLALEVLGRLRLRRGPKRPWDLVKVAGSRAQRRYRPYVSNIRVDFFRAQTEPGTEPTPWEPYARGGVLLHQIVDPGIHHDNILREPAVRTLAQLMRGALDGQQHAGAPVNGVAHTNGAAESGGAVSANGHTGEKGASFIGAKV